MARICGICPVSHLIASAKACDALLAVRIPPTADKLRRIFGLAQVMQSHALSLFHLSSPDLLLGMDADPAKSNIFGVAEKNPAAGARRHQAAPVRTADHRAAGRQAHSSRMDRARRRQRAADRSESRRHPGGAPEALAIAERTLEWFKSIMERFREEISTFGNFPTMFMGIVKEDDGLTFYDGKLRIVDASGRRRRRRSRSHQLLRLHRRESRALELSEIHLLQAQGISRRHLPGGPLARLNVADRCGTPRADQELAEFHELQRTAVLSSFHYHHARLIEILYCIERLEQLLNDPEILSKHVRAVARPNALEGVGACEAPRGTLFHHYKIDEQGLIRWVNLIIATGHNNLAMNRSVLQVAKHFVHGQAPDSGDAEPGGGRDPLLRSVPELLDPRHGPDADLQIQLISPEGEVLDEVARRN